MDARKFYCTVCLHEVERAELAGEELPEAELATSDALVHNGVRLEMERLCDRHSTSTIAYARMHWGLELSDEALAFPMFLN